jgi:hypothetical protein
MRDSSANESSRFTAPPGMHGQGMAVRDVLVIEGFPPAPSGRQSSGPILAKGWAAASAQKIAPHDSAKGAILG